MQYENPDIPEGINVSREHPLREFAVLVGGALALIAAIVLVLGFLAETIARQIPFSYEQDIVSGFASDTPDDPAAAAVERYLQQLADELVPHMDLPEDMRITVHYSADNTVNAFATLGGHIVMFRGLLDNLPHENALAMVMAHEIAHVQHRHPIVSLGRGVTVGLALAVLAGVSGSDLADRVLGSAGTFTALSYSRAQEREADRSALAAVAAHYGHIGGAASLFDLFVELEQERLLRPPEFMNSHPDSAGRRDAIRLLAQEKDWALDGPLTPLGEPLRKDLPLPRDTPGQAGQQITQ